MMGCRRISDSSVVPGIHSVTLLHVVGRHTHEQRDYERIRQGKPDTMMLTYIRYSCKNNRPEACATASQVLC
jgi:hypothetical protein